jgi:DNA replication factor GINS
MNLDELRTVQSKERSKDSLQHLRESFYADVADYIAELKEQREQAAESADSPFDDPEVNRLTDEVKTAEDVVEAIYERRVGKIVKRASLAAAGMPADEEGLTNEEQELFTELVERIESNKEEVLDILAGESDPDVSPTPTPAESTAGGADSRAEAPDSSAAVDKSSAADSTPEPGDTPTPGTSADESDEDVSAADVMGGTATDAAESSSASSATDGDSTPATDSDDARPAADEAAAIADGPDDPASESSDDGEDSEDEEGLLADLDERTTIRITDDVGEIFGVDERTYELASEDVVTLPEANAAPLVERGAAEELE